MENKYKIPLTCLDCRFFSENEDVECWCSLYDKSFEYDENEETLFNHGRTKPRFCKAKEVVVTVYE